jgi:hypothetical protein
VWLPAPALIDVDALSAALDHLAMLRARFPDSRVEELIFVRSPSMPMVDARPAAGYVQPSLPRRVHLNARHVAVEAGSAAGTQPSPARLGHVVAHEVWHVVERDFEVADYRRSIAFRRAVGELFGVVTLEALFDGGSPRAPAAVRAGYTRLGAEVGSYAQTNRVEASAELFAGWWCAAGPSPLLTAFGALVERFLPRPGP